MKRKLAGLLVLTMMVNSFTMTSYAIADIDELAVEAELLVKDKEDTIISCGDIVVDENSVDLEPGALDTTMELDVDGNTTTEEIELSNPSVGGRLATVTDQEVPYGNYLTRSDYYWAESGIHAYLPSGWELLDTHTCKCGKEAMLVQGDGVFAVVHAHFWLDSVSYHYYQWTVTLADGTKVSVDNSEIYEGEARQLDLRTTNLAKGNNTAVGVDGTRYMIINGSSTPLRVWLMQKDGKYSMPTFYNSNSAAVQNYVYSTANKSLASVEYTYSEQNRNIINLTVTDEGKKTTLNLFGLKNNEMVEFPTHTINGTYIKSWNDGENYRGNVIDTDPYVVPNITSTSYKLYARTLDFWHVFYDTNGNIYGTSGHNIGEDIEMIADPYKNNYEFYDWYYDKGLVNRFNEEDEINSDLDLYAMFGTIRLNTEIYTGPDKIELEVKVPPGGFIVQTDADENYTEEDKLVITKDSQSFELDDPGVVEGYIFDDWNVVYDEDYNALIVPTYKEVVEVVIYDADEKEISRIEAALDATITVLDDLGDVISTNPVDSENLTVDLPNPPLKADHVFDEWLVERDANNNITITPQYKEIFNVNIVFDNETIDKIDIVEGNNIIIDYPYEDSDYYEVKSDIQEFVLTEPGIIYGYVHTGWEIDDSGDDIIIKPIYHQQVNLVLEIYDENNTLLEDYTLTQDTNLYVYDKDLEELRKETVVVNHTLGQLLPVSVLLRNVGLGFSSLEYVSGTHVKAKLQEADYITGHNFSHWDVSYDNNNIDISPIYVKIISLEILDSEGISLDDVEVEVGKELIIYDENGTPTRVLVTDGDSEYSLPVHTEVEGSIFTGWDIQVNANGEPEIKPTYREDLIKVPVGDLGDFDVNTKNEVIVEDEDGDTTSYPVYDNMDKILLPELSVEYKWETKYDKEGNLLVTAIEDPSYVKPGTGNTEDTNESPEDTNESPEDTNESPEDTNESPEDTNESPEDTNDTVEDANESSDDQSDSTDIPKTGDETTMFMWLLLGMMSLIFGIKVYRREN